MPGQVAEVTRHIEILAGQPADAEKMGIEVQLVGGDHVADDLGRIADADLPGQIRGVGGEPVLGAVALERGRDQ